MVTNILIIGISFLLLFVALRFVHELYPVEQFKPGKQIHVYMDNRYNRTATISHNNSDSILIYDKFHLPVHHKFKFYAIGYMEDGHTLMFLGKRKLYFLARLAEIIRKIAGTPEYIDPTVEVDISVNVNKEANNGEDKE